MELMEEILSRDNLNEAYKRVKKNKGCAGIDEMTVTELNEYIKENREGIISSIKNRTYKPKPVKRVYIPKGNNKQRPLGIPTVMDRVIQQAISQVLGQKYEPLFSNHSYGFRPGRDCHQAIDEVLLYLNEGYEWVIDIDIEKFFDTVNQDKLISILREQVNDSDTLHLIRNFLKAGIMENGIVKASQIGMPQGGPLCPLLSNIYLDKLDKELEGRGLRFVRYADDCNIFVKSEKAADRVIESITSWIERKLFLKVSATKTKVVRPSQSKFLGFKFLKTSNGWLPSPLEEKKKALYEKVRTYLKRNKAVARSLNETITKLNQMIKGWINYFRIGRMKVFMDTFGQWLRHKVRVIILKQWKTPTTIYRNLQRINKSRNIGLSDEEVFKVANSRKGWYKRCAMNTVNYLLNNTILENKIKDKPGLVSPLAYYSR